MDTFKFPVPLAGPKCSEYSIKPHLQSGLCGTEPADPLCPFCHGPPFKDWTLQESIEVGASEPRESYTILSAGPVDM